MIRTERREVRIVKCDLCHEEFEEPEHYQEKTNSFMLKRESESDEISIDICNICYDALKEYFKKGV
jgi:hypothetical protein